MAVAARLWQSQPYIYSNLILPDSKNTKPPSFNLELLSLQSISSRLSFTAPEVPMMLDGHHWKRRIISDVDTGETEVKDNWRLRTLKYNDGHRNPTPPP